MKFTQEQSIAFGRMINFIESNDQRRVFILKGYAGTGKTTLIKELYKHYLEKKCSDKDKLNYKNFKIDVTATTGRASQILSNKILKDGRICSLLQGFDTHFDEVESDIELDEFTSQNVKLSKLVKTVHSLLYRYEDISKDVEHIGINEFARKTLLVYSPVRSDDSGVVIVDEASMLSEDTSNSDSFALFGSGNLLKDLFESLPNKKFIFVGDPLQLPPVGSNFSPALSASHLERRYQLKVEEYELRKIIRQPENSGILFAGKLLRWQAEHPRHSKRVVFYIKGVNDLNFKPEGTFLDNYVQAAKKYLKKDNELGLREFIKNNIYIVLSNYKAHSNNNYFRYHIFGKKIKVLNVGDILQVTQNNYRYKLFNGDFIQVLRIKEREQFCQLNFVNLDVQNIYDEEQLVYNDVLLIESILESGKNNISHSSQNCLIRNALLKIKYSDKKEREEIAMVDDWWKMAWNDIKKDLFQAIDNCHNVLEKSLKELKNNTINTISKIIKHINDYLIVGSNYDYQLAPNVPEQERSVLMYLMNKYSDYLHPVSKNKIEIQNKEELERKLSYSLVFRSTIKLLLSNDRYLNALKAVYGYVITCHKAQGGEWDKVYVQGDESLQKISAPYKWLYTAVTRARKEVDVCDFWHFDYKDELLDKLTDMV